NEVVNERGRIGRVRYARPVRPLAGNLIATNDDPRWFVVRELFRDRLIGHTKILRRGAVAHNWPFRTGGFLDLDPVAAPRARDRGLDCAHPAVAVLERRERLELLTGARPVTLEEHL